ncbi:MAG TPA: VCBS repeat-containing protein, partial [Acidimicrobiales bacterium]
MKRTRRFGVVVVAAATASVLPTIESTATAPTAVSFAPVAAYASDTQPWGIATADFDRDGDIDVVTGNRFGDSVSVHPSNGDGTFAARTDMDIPDAGNNPGDFGAANVATGDLNRDGNPDIVASAKVSGTLSVFLGNGAGGFAARTDYAVCSDPMGVALADFDRDGDLDVATAGNGNLCVYDGDGAGGIGAATGVGAFPSRGVVTGDFDRDGDLDLAAVEVNANAQVALNDGTGNFGAPTAYAATPLGFSWAITTADYNGDAILDLAVGNQEGDNVSVLAGVGDGTFAARTDYAVGNRPHAIASGDFNRDGAIDIATGNTHTDDVSILVGDGAGTFSPAVHVAVGNDPEALAIADFDRDGAPDVASINASGGFLEILLNTVPGGGGNFNTKIDFATGASPRAMATADFDRDGNIDVATVNPFDDTVRVGLGAGDGNVAAPSVFATGDAPDRVAVGDLNRDGREDLVVTNGLGDSVSVLLANGPATFAAKTDVAVGDSPGPVVMGDFNRDAKLDVAAASENG